MHFHFGGVFIVVVVVETDNGVVGDVVDTTDTEERFFFLISRILESFVDDDDDKSADGDLTSADANQVPNAFPFVAILPSLSLLAVIPKPRKSSSLTFILLYKDMATR